MERDSLQHDLSLDTIREGVTVRLMPVALIALLLSWVLLLSRWSDTGFYFILAIQTLLIVVVILLIVFRRKMKPIASARGMILVMGLIMLVGIARQGILSAAFVLGPVISLYLVILGYRKLAYGSIVLMFLYVTVMAVLHTSGTMSPASDPNLYIRSPLAWMIVIVSVTGISIAAVFPFEASVETIQRNRERFRRSFHHAGVGVCVTSAEGRLLQVNPALANLLGYPVDGLEGTLISEVTHESDRDLIRRIIADGQQATTPSPAMECRLRHKNGETVWVQVASTAIQEPMGAPNYSITHIQDITDRKRAVDALQASEARMRAILENSRDAIGVHLDGIWQACNPAATRLFGVASAEDLLGKSILEVVAPSERARIAGYAEKRMAEAEAPDTYVTIGLRRDGTTFDMEVSASAYMLEGRRHAIVIIRDITTRIAAVEALREAESRYRTLVEHTPDVIVRIGKDRRYAFVNQAMRGVSQLEPEEYIGKTVWEVGLTEDHARLRSDLVDLVFESRQPVEKEIETLTSIGPKTYEFRALPEVDAKGEVQSVLVINRDITARKEAEKISSRHVYEMSLLLETTKDLSTLQSDLGLLLRSIVHRAMKLLQRPDGGVYLYNRERNDLEYIAATGNDNPVGLRVKMGEGMAGRVAESRLPLIIDDYKSWPERLPAYAQTDITAVVEVPMLYRGDLVGVLVVEEAGDNARPFTEDDVRLLTIFAGQAAGAVHSARLFSELRKSDERYRLLFDHAPVGILLANDKGEILEVNSTSLEILGSPSAEMTKQINILTFPPLVQSGISEAFQRCVRTGNSMRAEYPYSSKWGRNIHMHLRCVPIFGQGGKVELVHVIAEDVSERKRAEAERKSLEQQLFQSQRLESIGTLAAGIAHDFNNILTAIVGNADLIRDMPKDAENVTKRSDNIAMAAERGSKVVNQLMTLARKTALEKKVVDINELLEEVSRLLGETLPRTYELTLNLDKQLPKVTADPIQLHQVLLNLCFNARDSMSGGGRIIMTSSEIAGSQIRSRFHDATAETYVVVSVRDEGVGIDESMRSKIFDPFFTTKDVGQGTGLGLSVALGIVERHEGFMEVHSVVGRGSEFFVYLPASAEGDSQESQDGSALATLHEGHETILFIEDEEQILETQVGILRKKGYEVIPAREGKEALELFARHQQEISIVLSDFGLPGYSGEEIFRRVRSIRPEIPFILLTGFIEQQKVQNLVELGIQKVIQKPYRFSEMLSAVREALDRRSA